jgi:hypothetical protein
LPIRGSEKPYLTVTYGQLTPAFLASGRDGGRGNGKILVSITFLKQSKINRIRQQCGVLFLNRRE